MRFTYTHAETRYALGVTDDRERLKARGFELEKLKNTWTSDQYKGINSQWLEPSAGELEGFQSRVRGSWLASAGWRGSSGRSPAACSPLSDTHPRGF